MTHCTECGKDINSADKFCGHCGRSITNSALEGQSNEPILINNANDYTPLTGNERIKVTSFFIILTIGSILILGLIPMLIVVGSIYSMNKDGDFMRVGDTKKYIVRYVTFVGYAIAIFSAILGSEQIQRLQYSLYEHGLLDILDRTHFMGLAVLWALGTYSLANHAIPKLYFNILESHKSWVEKNGIYGD